jgi:hypothetical protein
MGGWEALVRPDWVVGWSFVCCVDFFFPSVCVGAALSCLAQKVFIVFIQAFSLSKKVPIIRFGTSINTIKLHVERQIGFY